MPSDVSRETPDGRKASGANEGCDESLHVEAVDVVVSRETSGYHQGTSPGPRFPHEQQVSGPLPPEPPDVFTRNAQAAGYGSHTTGEAPAHSMQYQMDSASGSHSTRRLIPCFSMTKVPRFTVRFCSARAIDGVLCSSEVPAHRSSPHDPSHSGIAWTRAPCSQE